MMRRCKLENDSVSPIFSGYGCHVPSGLQAVL